jgi:ABC-type transport system involved in Fe-S cluster assembly fused permease/ATPase subunit
LREFSNQLHFRCFYKNITNYSQGFSTSIEIMSSSFDTTTPTAVKAEVLQASSMVVLAACVAITMQLLRVSVDLIQVASQPVEKKDDAKLKKKNSALLSKKSSYGSVENNNDAATAGGNKTETKNSNGTVAAAAAAAAADEEQQALLLQSSSSSSTQAPPPTPFSATVLPRISLLCHGILAILFVAVPLFCSPTPNTIFPASLNNSTVFCLILGISMALRDAKRTRFGLFQRFFYATSTFSLAAAYLGVVGYNLYFSLPSTQTTRTTSTFDMILLAAISFYVGLTLVDVCVTTGTAAGATAPEVTTGSEKRYLSRKALLTMLKPYFWPDATDSSAVLNRVRAILTWVCVACSKVCNLVSPILLGWASTALAHQQYHDCIKWSILYSFLQFVGSALKEGQSLVYLKVAQAAFVQLSETTFGHVHNLSLDWHLRKKLGEVIRSMDRGIAACDTLMKYLFLWLLPALVECLVVCAIFASYFAYLPLGISVFYFVFVYIVWTILVTLWRKKFRKAVVQSDNEWHDRCTDSLINFETVKYFTAEDYEMRRFGEAVRHYQQGSVNVQASLSFLNVSQKLIMQACLATSLSLAAYGIQKRSDCCIHEMQCDSVFSECCQATTNLECPGMEVGDFVAVLTYTLNLFQPLNFLGSIYNAVVMAVIDLHNLSELLAENPDVTDAPNAPALPPSNATDPDVVVEFDNVVFHYPTQPSTKGLKGLSFKMKRGTTTAIVGPTGAGKTTVSRLLFRFYDVLGGSVRINGADVRSVTQKSLRQAIGVVPQAASMFNDTIRANMLYGKRDATEEQLIQAAKDAQLLDFIEGLDEGWESLVGDRGLKLSGGEKQRGKAFV